MKGYQANIEELTLANSNFRRVLYTGQHTQLVLMSLPPKGEIGLEVHPEVDQFFRVEKGKAQAVLDGVEQELSDGDVLIVPAGTNHNVINLSETEDLKLYTLYSPPNHRDGVVHATREEAEKDDEHFDGQTSK